MEHSGGRGRLAGDPAHDDAEGAPDVGVELGGGDRGVGGEVDLVVEGLELRGERRGRDEGPVRGEVRDSNADDGFEEIGAGACGLVGDGGAPVVADYPL